MKIASAAVSLTSTHEFHREQSREESLRVWIGREPPRPAAGGEEGDAVRVRLSPQAGRMPAAPPPPPQPVEAAESEGPTEDPKLQTMRLILEALTGRKIRISRFESAAPGRAEPAAEQEPARMGWGLAYDFAERLREEETLLFAAAGQIRTTDGRSIDFRLDVAMHRLFVQETTLQIRAGDALLVDPLVVNFAAPAAELSDMKFSFDLLGDGRLREIAFPAAGSGFLALDRNSDGIINNGLELFGPASGKGFAELARLDADGNGWLDENDPLFASLRIWMRDAAGNDTLAPLQEKNIGALFLGATATPFSLKNGENVLLARVKESSIFLTESGGAGTIQELDFAV